MTDDEADKWSTAHADLARAITAYYAAVGDEYVDAWVLVTHKRSVELEQEGSSAIGIMTAPEQSWVMSRGMLEIAVSSPLFGGRGEE